MKGVNSKLNDYFLLSNNGDLYKNVVGHVEKVIIEKVLERVCGNQVRASKMLGLNRNTLHNKLKKLHIDVSRFKR